MKQNQTRMTNDNTGPGTARHGASLALGLAFTIALFQSGCGVTDPEPGGDEGFGGNIPVATATTGATVTGYVFEQPGAGKAGEARLVASPVDAPAGSTPVTGATITIRRNDDPIAGGTTTADGSFRITDLPAGALLLTVTLPGSASGSDDLSIAFSGVPNTEFALGREYAVTRTDAAASAVGLAGDGDLVVGTLQPLPEGTIVYPSLFAVPSVTSVPAGDAIVLNEPSYLFFVDTDPSALYGHPVRFALVGAQSGDMRTLEADWPPAVNHAPHWMRETDYLRFAGVDPAAFDADLLPPGATYNGTAEVVQLPDYAFSKSFAHGAGPSTFTATGARNATGNKTAGNEDTFVIILKGDSRSDFRGDLRAFREWALAQGIPAPQIAAVDLAETPYVPHHESPYKLAFEAFNAEIKRRLEEENRESTLIVFVTAHGAKESEPRFFIRHTEFQDTWQVHDLCLQSSYACKLRVFLNMCFAERFALRLEPLIREYDYRIAASSGIAETSRAGAMAYAIATETTPGGFFTKAVVERARVENNEITNLYEGRVSGLILTDHSVLEHQTPVLHGQVNDPPWCADGYFDLVATTYEEPASYTHLASDSFPWDAGRFTLTNNTDTTVTITIRLNSPYFRVAEAGTTFTGELFQLPVKSQRSFAVHYVQESGESLATTTIALRGTTPDGREDTDLVPIEIRNEPVWVEDFPVRPVVSALGSKTVQFWVRIGEDVEVVSTELIDLVTGLPPTSAPFAECPGQGFSLTYEGRRVPEADYYGIIFELSNWFANCSAPERRWQYRVRFKR